MTKGRIAWQKFTGFTVGQERGLKGERFLIERFKLSDTEGDIWEVFDFKANRMLGKKRRRDDAMRLCEEQLDKEVKPSLEGFEDACEVGT